MLLSFSEFAQIFILPRWSLKIKVDASFILGSRLVSTLYYNRFHISHKRAVFHFNIINVHLNSRALNVGIYCAKKTNFTY